MYFLLINRRARSSLSTDESRAAASINPSEWTTVGREIGSQVERAEPNLAGSHYILRKTQMEAL
jgi:hypothetical protein